MNFEIDKLQVGPLATNCYFISCPETKKTIIVDPGWAPQQIKEYLQRQGYLPQAIVLTHGHADHIGAVEVLRQELSVPVMIHEADKHMLAVLGVGDVDRYLIANESLLLHKTKFMIIHTPGHTPGGICLYCVPVLFSGDTLFQNGVGRTDLPGGSWPSLELSIKNVLFKLPPETKVYPGHGPSTTISDERSSL